MHDVFGKVRVFCGQLPDAFLFGEQDFRGLGLAGRLSAIAVDSGGGKSALLRRMIFTSPVLTR